MIQALIGHLWQSTLFAVLVGLLTLAFRQNGANVRFSLWLAASLKFLLPFPLIALIGRHLRWESAPALRETSPFYVIADGFMSPGAVPEHYQAAAVRWDWWNLVWMLWALGAVALLIRWGSRWRDLRRAVQAGTLLDLGTPIPVYETSTAVEPGIFGVFRPVILLPRGILTHLESAHLQAVLTHELCHWRRKDNLTGALHMVVQALFWFHPIVWWLGIRLVAERERACDESVIHSGGDRQVYAEGILKVCKLYVEPGLLCAAGVSGGFLRKRIEEIMTMTIFAKLSVAKKTLLAVAGCLAVAGPLCIGFVEAPQAFAATPHVEWRPYKSAEWGFGLDIPATWNVFPPNPVNSRSEVIRFASYEAGYHGLIVFRNPHTPGEDVKTTVIKTQEVLTKAGFGNFVVSETSIGSARVGMLDFDKQEAGKAPWYCRQYFIADGTLIYVLGFGTTDRDAMFGLYDRMAKSFVTSQ